MELITMQSTENCKKEGWRKATENPWELGCHFKNGYICANFILEHYFTFSSVTNSFHMEIHRKTPQEGIAYLWFPCFKALHEEKEKKIIYQKLFSFLPKRFLQCEPLVLLLFVLITLTEPLGVTRFYLQHTLGVIKISGRLRCTLSSPAGLCRS